MQGDNAAKAGKGTRRKEDSPSTDGEVSKHMTWIKDKVTRKGKGRRHLKAQGVEEKTLK